MTREEALNKYPNGWMEEGGYNDYPKDEIVNKIYDDLESRTCKNCKYCDSQFRYEPCPIADEMIQDIGVNFGCNEFKRKLNDNK